MTPAKQGDELALHVEMLRVPNSSRATRLLGYSDAH